MVTVRLLALMPCTRYIHCILSYKRYRIVVNQLSVGIYPL